MRDPHVVALTYRLNAGAGIEFQNAPAVEWDTDIFHLRLDADRARLDMKEHYSFEDEARKKA